MPKKRIAVLLGGRSSEREVSLNSGGACADGLVRKGYDVVRIDPQDPDWVEALTASRPDVVFNALHGPWGEDGRVQGVLEYLGLPYTHSGVLASALAMDKDKAKAVFAAAGIDVPKGVRASRTEVLAGVGMERPFVIKPNAEGSSVGVFIVQENDPLPDALSDPASGLSDDLIVEEFIAGRELTVTVMHDRGALAVTEITTALEFYDYEAKYAAGGSLHIVPAEIPDEIKNRVMQDAVTAHKALDCRGLTRSDFRYDPEKDRVALLELNTQAGMTSTSLAPEQAAYVGLTFDDLVAWMSEDASCPR